MKLIATHNSVTGEAGEGFLSWLVAPFSKCQSKTLEEQYEAGVRYFDIRIFLDNKSGCWRCGHGLWTSKVWYRDIRYGIFIGHDDIRYSLTFEKGDDNEYEKFRKTFGDPFEDERLTYVAVKHPQWRVLAKADNAVGFVTKYVNLDGSTWHTLLPIPWLWKKICYNHPEFNETYFTMVDFV